MININRTIIKYTPFISTAFIIIKNKGVYKNLEKKFKFCIEYLNFI